MGFDFEVLREGGTHCVGRDGDVVARVDLAVGGVEASVTSGEVSLLIGQLW